MPAYWADMVGWASRPNRRRCAIAEQTRADKHARVVVEVEGGAANLNANGQDVLRLARIEQRFGRAQVGQGSAATLADQVEVQNVVPQSQPLAYVAGQAGAQITSAGADDQSVH